MKLPKINLNLKRWQIYTGIWVVIAVVLYVAFYQVSMFYETHRVRFQAPIVFQAPFVIETRATPELLSPAAATHSAIPMPQARAAEDVNKTPEIVHIQPTNVNKLVNYIWFAESKNGTAGFEGSLQYLCEQKGMWNELGYGGMALKHCFKDRAEGWAHVTSWLNRHLDKYEGNEARALCRYNLGGEEINCKYYQGFLTWRDK